MTFLLESGANLSLMASITDVLDSVPIPTYPESLTFKRGSPELFCSLSVSPPPITFKPSDMTTRCVEIEAVPIPILQELLLSLLDPVPLYPN